MISQQSNSKKCNMFLRPKMIYIFKKIFWLVLAENEIKNHCINLTHGCLCSDYVDGYAKGMFLFLFFIWYSQRSHYFEVATGTTISCSLGSPYRPVFSLSFLDVYDYDGSTFLHNIHFELVS
jgi:hypothetical protein